MSSHIKITFPEIDQSRICLIKIAKSSKPVIIEYEGKEEFFIRLGCSSQPLTREKQSQYERQRWVSG